MKHIKKTIIIIILFLLLGFTSNTSAIISDDLKNEHHLNILSKTYGFFLGQKYTSDQVIKKFPNYKMDITLARKKFNNKFGSSIDNIENNFINLFGEKKFMKIKNNSENQIQLSLENYINKLKKNNIPNIINNLEQRSKGQKIPKDILSTLLIYNNRYIKQPHKEVLDGFFKKYYTQNSSKAQGIEMIIKIPYSWKEMEAERPHIVKEFKSENGNGLESIMVIIQKDKTVKKASNTFKEAKEKDINFSKQKIDELCKEYIPYNSNYINGNLIYIETLPTLEIRYNIKKDRMGFSILMETLNYYIFYNDYLIMLQFITSTNNNLAENLNTEEFKKKNSKKRYQKYEPLFQIIANDIVINNVWEN